MISDFNICCGFSVDGEGSIAGCAISVPDR